MQCKRRRQRFWWSVAGTTVLVAAIAVSLVVLAGGDDGRFTATSYADVIRFEAEGVATLQVRIFDLSGKEVWDSGVVSGGIVDWDRTNEWGERLAYGAYLYTAQGWSADGVLVLQKNGKLALLPGDKVQLQQAPTGASKFVEVVTPGSSDAQVRPMAGGAACSCNEFSGANKDVYVEGKVGVGTTSPIKSLHVKATGDAGVVIDSPLGYAANFIMATNGSFKWHFEKNNDGSFRIVESHVAYRLTILPTSGNVGIGTTSPSATLEVHGAAANLLALYDPVAPTDPKFRVEKTGNVRADGAYYSGTGGYYTGSADVAERINTSEWVEEGNVVEIDPEHPGFFFRKAGSPYSTRVAGIISTSPGVVLGNDFDATEDKWEDNRPVLAIAGRVPCKVSAENGSIQIGDLLVSSSTPGVAMKGSDREDCVGAVVGKALEPLDVATGMIMVQVMLR